MKTVFKKFLEIVENYPFHNALSIDGVEYSYIELKNYAIKLSNFINGICPDVKQLAIFCYKTKEAYASVLASLALGVSFIPLNKKFPADRTANMILQSGVKVLVVDQESLEKLYELPKNILSNLIIVAPELLYHEKSFLFKKFLSKKEFQLFYQNTYQEKIIHSDDVAYLLFTSGSTGIPKGVPISHRNLSTFVFYNLKKYGFTVRDRFTQTFDLTFDLSLFDLFMAWCSGGCLYVAPPGTLLSPQDFLNKNEITVWFSVPSVIYLLIQQKKLSSSLFATLRYSFFCGEALNIGAAEEWAKAAPHSVLENLYGPTEVTIACSAYRWQGDESEKFGANQSVPIGKIYEHLDFVIIDEHFKECTEGELCICGDQKFSGYWKNDEKTREVIFSFSKNNTIKNYYKTGDIVELLPNGDILYRSRLDQQIKLQGYRIELGEIEANLKRIEGVLNAIVVSIFGHNKKINGIAAHVIGDNLSEVELKNKLSKILPSYMIPKKIFLKTELPLNVNGKVDRKKLILESDYLVAV